MVLIRIMSLFLVLVFLFTLTYAYALSSSSSSSPSIIIIGAGMSGISSAKTLDEDGITDFLILEATDRIGGRIRKANFQGHTVEMGANWLHGVGGHMKNPLYEMAKKIDLKTYFSDFKNVSFNTYKQGGGMYKDSEVNSAITRVEKALALAKEMSKSSDDDLSILASERLNKLEPRTPLEKMIEYFYFDGEQAEGSRVTSLKHVVPFAESENYGEDSYFVADKRGFESLVHHIARQFLTYDHDVVSDPRVIFNQVVNEIDQSESGVTIKTEDGKEYHAKLVIVSTSLGVLQSDLIKFNPELPLGKRLAISEFDIGVYTKIFLKFPHKFWPTGDGTEFFFYVHERRGYYAIWQHLENEYPGSNIMFVTLTDEEAIRVEQQSNKKTKEEAMEVLKKMFGKNIPQATHIMIPRWKTDRFFQGCFTNWPVGYPQKRHDELRAPFNHIYFTGEHTHPTLFGYADGAYFAGKSTARDCVDKLLENKGKSKREEEHQSCWIIEKMRGWRDSFYIDFVAAKGQVKLFNSTQLVHIILFCSFLMFVKKLFC